jgi:putative ABC transport system ATP-binding protein
MSAIIKLENVKTWYNHGKSNEVYALKNINIEVEAGDYAAFFGPSGCGKTTMLYAISGIDRVSEGKIIIKDRDIAQLTNQELAIFRQAGIGIVFQQFNLVPSLNVLQNVALPMAFVGMSEDKAEIEAAKLLDQMKLTEYALRFPAELSGGQQQRVGIARALANNPPIIIADEPFGNLDSINAKNALAILKELNEKYGKTIIMVTHEAWSLQDVRTVYHMKDGEVTNIEKRTPKIEEASGKTSGESLEKLAEK